MRIYLLRGSGLHFRNDRNQWPLALVIAVIWLGSVLAGRAYAAPGSRPEVLPGVEVLCADYARDLSGKRVGILTNPSGIDRNFVSTIDRVRALPGVTVVRLFSPEHGLRGAFAAGARVSETRDPFSGLPIVSLHGDSRRPPLSALRDLDVVLYDIQDIGSRSYTFVSTMTYMMEACEKAGVEFWVLDRPAPDGGDKVGGPMLDPANKSFIGVMNVPLQYGLTPGEWARLVQAERTPRLKLRVIPMRGWRRGMTYDELGWAWVPPSEHIPHWRTALFYAMTGALGELHRVSEGVGTPLPFEQIGAPWIDAPALEKKLNALQLPGVRFRATTFRPRYETYQGEVCQGVQIHLIDPKACDPAAVGAALLETLSVMYHSRGVFRSAPTEEYGMFLRALGDSDYARALAAGGPFEESLAKIRRGQAEYLRHRTAVLLYH